MNELLLIIILLVLIVGLAAIFLVLRGKKEEGAGDQPFRILNDNITNRITEMNQALDKKLSDMNKLSSEVSRELGRVFEAQNQTNVVTKQLESILKDPKRRGMLGEHLLEVALRDVFVRPHQYETQYKFSDRTIVDAVVFVGDKIIPIDAKFSSDKYRGRLENAKDETERIIIEDEVKQDLKNRIDETAKYVKPSEKTIEFAFMFIPSETLYYDLLAKKIGSQGLDLIEYAMKKKVVIVSPTSLYAYLQTVHQALEALYIAESAQKIVRRVGDLRRHLLSFEEYFQKLKIHLTTTKNMYDSAEKEYEKIDKDFLKINEEAMETEPKIIEGPTNEEG